MIRSSHAVLVASVVAAVTVGFGSTANTSATDALDPFLCYDVGRGAAPDAGAADLADMLGSADARLRAPQRFCNPIGSPPNAPNDHLVGYEVAVWKLRFNHLPNQTVILPAPLGAQVIDVRRPAYLLVPSAESLDGPLTHGAYEPGIDHFTCYRASGRRLSAVMPAVQDHFGSHDLDLRRPVHVCVPTSKNGEPILGGATSLMCYQVRDKSAQPRRTLYIDNQFGAASITTRRSREVCLPAQFGTSYPATPTPTPADVLTPSPSGTPEDVATPSPSATSTPFVIFVPPTIVIQTPTPTPTSTLQPFPSFVIEFPTPTPTSTLPPGQCATDSACPADNNPCTRDVCVGGFCTHEPRADCCANDAGCADTDPCTSDSCWLNSISLTEGQYGECVHENFCCQDHLDCNDNDRCTLEACGGRPEFEGSGSTFEGADGCWRANRSAYGQPCPPLPSACCTEVNDYNRCIADNCGAFATCMRPTDSSSAGSCVSNTLLGPLAISVYSPCGTLFTGFVTCPAGTYCTSIPGRNWSECW